jgi:hypothetical protein
MPSADYAGKIPEMTPTTSRVDMILCGAIVLFPDFRTFGLKIQQSSRLFGWLQLLLDAPLTKHG